jgi:hypothetical protein
VRGKIAWLIGVALVVVAFEWLAKDPKPAPSPDVSVQRFIERFSEHSEVASRFLTHFNAEDYDRAASYMAPAIRSPSALETQRKPLGQPARVTGERSWQSASHASGRPPEFHYRVEYANGIFYLHVGVAHTEQGLQVVSFRVE